MQLPCIVWGKKEENSANDIMCVHNIILEVRIQPNIKISPGSMDMCPDASVQSLSDKRRHQNHVKQTEN
jgi:hypothetical protein